jgi:hypothetical protein
MKFRNFLSKFWGFLKKHRWSIILITLALGVGGFFVWDSFTAGTPFVNTGITIPERKPVTVAAPLSGRQITEEQSRKRPIAIVVENHPDARPQAGLNDADIVFETTAEGGITRFLAIYQSSEPKQIGPVRSARSYFVEWADSYGALFAHVGGSQEALNLIKKIKIDDLNQFYFGSFYWREKSRFAPHNVYTTIEKLRSAAATKRYKTDDVTVKGYLFKEEAPIASRPAAHQFKVNFNVSYAPTYFYDPVGNHYERSLVGVRQVDANTGEAVKAKNVVVAFSNLTNQLIRGTGYTIIDTTDKGTAFFYIDGVKITGTWSRAAGELTKFYDASGEAIKFSSGTTWIDFVARGTIVQ